MLASREEVTSDCQRFRDLVSFAEEFYPDLSQDQIVFLENHSKSCLDCARFLASVLETQRMWLWLAEAL